MLSAYSFTRQLLCGFPLSGCGYPTRDGRQLLLPAQSRLARAPSQLCPPTAAKWWTVRRAASPRAAAPIERAKGGSNERRPDRVIGVKWWLAVERLAGRGSRAILLFAAR